MGRKKSKRGRQMVLSKSLENRIDAFDDFEVTLAREVYKGKQVKQVDLESEVSDMVFGDSVKNNNFANDEATNKVVIGILVVGFVLVVAVVGYIILMMGR